MQGQRLIAVKPMENNIRALNLEAIVAESFVISEDALSIELPAGASPTPLSPLAPLIAQAEFPDLIRPLTHAFPAPRGAGAPPDARNADPALPGSRGHHSPSPQDNP